MGRIAPAVFVLATWARHVAIAHVQTWDVRVGFGTLAAHSAHAGQNTTDGKMEPLGIKKSWQDCRDACSTDNTCLSFDFHTNERLFDFDEPKTTVSWNGWCYSRIVPDFPVFKESGRVAGYKGTPPAPTPDVPTPVPPTPGPTPAGLCEKDDDCSLNGLCNTTSSKCICDPQWFGEQCQYLNILPTSPNNGLQSSVSSSWGGSIIEGPDGKTHMFAAVMTEHCGLTSWKTNSEVIHAVANTPLGPFVKKEVVIPRFAHNPTIKKVNGTYLLFHIGKLHDRML